MTLKEPNCKTHVQISLENEQQDPESRGCGVKHQFDGHYLSTLPRLRVVIETLAFLFIRMR